MTASRVRGSIDEVSREWRGTDRSHTSGEAMQLLSITLQLSQLLSLPLQPLPVIQIVAHGLKNNKFHDDSDRRSASPAVYTQILPTQITMKDRLAVPAPQRRFRIELAIFRACLRRPVVIII